MNQTLPSAERIHNQFMSLKVIFHSLKSLVSMGNAGYLNPFGCEAIGELK